MRSLRLSWYWYHQLENDSTENRLSLVPQETKWIPHSHSMREKELKLLFTQKAQLPKQRLPANRHSWFIHTLILSTVSYSLNLVDKLAVSWNDQLCLCPMQASKQTERTEMTKEGKAVHKWWPHISCAEDLQRRLQSEIHECFVLDKSTSQCVYGA